MPSERPEHAGESSHLDAGEPSSERGRDSLHPIEASHLHARRERVFLVLSGIFLGAMTMLNIVGITRFVQLGPLSVAVGVLPYPLTFLCTDLISELYGKRRAASLVWVGFAINLLVIATLWLGQALPSVPHAQQPPWQSLKLAEAVTLPDGSGYSTEVELFAMIYACTRGAVFASMVAYLAAQLCDVYLFHFWRQVTRGRHLWLRNNGSTLVSQLVDSVLVISLTFGGTLARGEITIAALVGLIFGTYAFKLVAALVDTGPFYAGVLFLRRYLDIGPEELDQDVAA